MTHFKVLVFWENPEDLLFYFNEENKYKFCDFAKENPEDFEEMKIKYETWGDQIIWIEWENVFTRSYWNELFIKEEMAKEDWNKRLVIWILFKNLYRNSFEDFLKYEYDIFSFSTIENNVEAVRYWYYFNPEAKFDYAVLWWRFNDYFNWYNNGFYNFFGTRIRKRDFNIRLARTNYKNVWYKIFKKFQDNCFNWEIPIIDPFNTGDKNTKLEKFDAYKSVMFGLDGSNEYREVLNKFTLGDMEKYKTPNAYWNSVAYSKFEVQAVVDTQWNWIDKEDNEIGWGKLVYKLIKNLDDSETITVVDCHI